MNNQGYSPNCEGDVLTCLRSKVFMAAKRARRFLCLPLLVLPLAAQDVSRLTLQESTDLQNWQPVPVTPEMLDPNGKILVPIDTAERFYRMQVDVVTLPAPLGFSLIPPGSFTMGDQSIPLLGFPEELPAHSVFVSEFFMAKHETSKELWDEVRAWALNNGYTDLPVGGGKAPNHPVHSIEWYAIVKWCNARSQKEGLTPCYTVSGETYKTGQSSDVSCNFAASGYRLPTEAEWEKAARGGLSAQNFPWGNTISHSQANYYSDGPDSYDVSPTRHDHPDWAVGDYPYSSQIGSFAPNDYGLHDMAGNMWEWCWDWYEDYSPTSQTDPRGPVSGSYRVIRGGSWDTSTVSARVASRSYYYPNSTGDNNGFRLARSPTP